ncbi:MAG: hypothetical protein PHF31_06910 [Methylobacter sp.]|jgi:PRTRC genetic system protein B|nr:hypothetical protein [Methylobacter sp.]
MQLSKDDSSVKYEWALPEKLQIPPDILKVRLDFYTQAVVMTQFEDGISATCLVSASEIAHALAAELSYNTGLLPKNVLWWSNTSEGPVLAIYSEPQIRTLSVRTGMNKGDCVNYKVPLPGLIFLCRKGSAPWVYAVKKYPNSLNCEVFHAPLLNVFRNGRTCAGSQRYVSNPGNIISEFFNSFFTDTANVDDRSKKFPNDVIDLWRYLDKKSAKKFPNNDLISWGTVGQLMKVCV